MWEDTQAWNSYTDNDFFQPNVYQPPSNQGSWGDSTNWWNSNPESSWNSSGWSDPNQGSVPWKQNYTYTPDPASKYYPMQGRDSQEVADRFMEQSKGNAQSALNAATQWRGGQFANAPVLRDASHDLWTRSAIQSNPALARVAAPVLSAGYSGAKYLAQMNPYLGPYIDRLMASWGMDPLYNASPAGFQEAWAGMRPAFRR